MPALTGKIGFKDTKRPGTGPERRGEWEDMGLKAHNRASIQHDENAGQTFLENIVSAAKAQYKVNFC